MRRFFTLFCLLLISFPVGLSVVGCTSNRNGEFCNGAGYGPKLGQLASIDLEPKITGISLAYGQTSQVSSPTGIDCKGTSVALSKINYGTTNLNLADISPSGAICGGTWNRTSPGGIADYTICTPPVASQVQNGDFVYLTVSSAGVTSNTVQVWVHPPVTSATLDGPPDCVSQNLTSQLNATAYVNGSSTPFCAPAGNPNGVPDCTVNLGHFTYTANNTNIVSIDQNGVATAHQPGTTAIQSSISGVSTNAGFFSTCGPASVTLTAPGGPGVIPITQGTPIPISVNAIDTKGNPIAGLALTYTSTDPSQIQVNGSGVVSTTFPGFSNVSAICEPPTCNPAPINELGVQGTGLPVTSNTLTFQSGGVSSNYLWMASPDSQRFSSIDLTTGIVGAPIRLPFQPNSMVADQGGQSLYFGSYRELMIYNASSGALTKEDTTVPGVVLAVSPDGGTIVINDQVNKLIYLYASSSGVTSSTGGLATHARFSPDGTSLYVVGPNMLYVHNAYTGWNSYPIPTTQGPDASCPLDNKGKNAFCVPDLAVTTPGVAAFLSGDSTTVARGFCADLTTTPPIYYPQAASVGAQTQHLARTPDGLHMLAADGTNLTDIALLDSGSSGQTGVPIGACPAGGLNIVTSFNEVPLPVTPSQVDQIVPSKDSTLAFVTYSGGSTPGAPLPVYHPANPATTPGSFTTVTLSGGATAPVSGIFSPDNLLFFVGTSGDNLVHLIDTKTLTDTKTLNPGLTDNNGNPVTVKYLAVRPRATT